MDYAACNIIYVDRTAGEDRLVKRGPGPLSQDNPYSRALPQTEGSVDELRNADRNVQTLLGTFSEGRFRNMNAINYLLTICSSYLYNWRCLRSKAVGITRCFCRRLNPNACTCGHTI